MKRPGLADFRSLTKERSASSGEPLADDGTSSVATVGLHGFRLRERGLPSTSGERGDLYVDEHPNVLKQFLAEDAARDAQTAPR